MNRKGFTLIELLATIVILALVVSISTYSITAIIKNSKEKNTELLINNIKNAAETYYQECTYSNNTSIVCNLSSVTLGSLVTNGYLKGNGKDANGKLTIIDTNTDESIAACTISIAYNNSTGKVSVTSIGGGSGCPSSY